MAQRDQIVHYLDGYLNVSAIQDSCPIGLQVEGKAEVQKIVTAVSASAQLFDEAVGRSADMILVHHGLFWDRDSRVIRGHLKQRLSILLQHDLSLLAYHLVLDQHPVLGNNVLAGQALGMQTIQALGEIGVQGFVESLSIVQLQQRVEAAFESKALVFSHGPKEIRRIGFCSGGGARGLSHAVAAKLDAYITGEVKEETLHLAKENNIHFLYAGHYATERMGIQALGEHVGQVFSLPVEFVDIGNPV